MNIISNIIQPWTKSAAEPELYSPARQKHQRTHIEDLSPIGYEMSEEHLQLVWGGINSSQIHTLTNGKDLNTDNDQS